MAPLDLRQWMIEQALPLWADRGFDREHGRFAEGLTLEGELIPDMPHRLTVQARQIHSYALAQRRGWCRGEAIIERAYRSMVRDYRRSDGWIFTIHRDGTPCDSRRDLYAQAFVLLAIGSYFGLTGERGLLALADEMLAELDRDFRMPSGGYRDSLPAVDAVRRQNPHMHLFEAFLNLWMNTHEPRYLQRAGEMFDLFTRRFFQLEGVLLEYFDDALAPGPDRIVEPGHHCEWVWLLRWYERETGAPVKRYVDPLLAHAERYGRDAAGLIVDELWADGTVRAASHRVWPMTEAIKAYRVEGRAGEAQSLASLLSKHFLSGVIPGGWMDRLDPLGRPAADYMPASSLYHLLGAVAEPETP